VCESCARALEIHAKFLSRIEQFRREFPGGSQAFMDVSGTAHCMNHHGTVRIALAQQLRLNLPIVDSDGTETLSIVFLRIVHSAARAAWYS
jgi:hypothetical protein